MYVNQKQEARYVLFLYGVEINLTRGRAYPAVGACLPCHTFNGQLAAFPIGMFEFNANSGCPINKPRRIWGADGVCA